MKSRSSHIRGKVFALLASLTALWAFAAYVTVQEGLSLLWLSTLNNNVGQPIESLVDALQQERRASVVILGEDVTGIRAHDRLATIRQSTDAAVARFEESALSTRVDWAGDSALIGHIKDLVTSLNTLKNTRSMIDSGNVDRTSIDTTFTNYISSSFLIYGSLSTLDDPNVAREGHDLVLLSQAREVMAQEDALLAGVIADGQFSGSEAAQFIQLVGTQRYLRQQAIIGLPPDDLALYQQLQDGADFTRFSDLENDVVSHARAGVRPPVSAADWQSVADSVLGELRQVVLKSTTNAIGHATPAATWVIVRLVLAAGLGLIAVIASIVISVTTARSLVRQLERLRNAAHELADERLPSVVERLRRGEEVDVGAEAPPLEFGNDEIGQVGHAFNAVQRTAIQSAVEQAELRRSVRDVFLSLARRSQALIHRQLGLLDTMERRTSEAEELEDLFRVDHLATRMRRNAENLIVLSGSTAGRGWRNAVPLVDVIRGALAEVEDYTRVTVLPVEAAALAGRAVGDVIHLLAELIENAVSFSPPYTTVHVSGALVANGFVIEIEDRGLGMSQPDLQAANEQLEDPPEFNLSSTARLGLFVVGRLAQRHSIKVKLRESPYGGTTAIVLVPSTLVVDAQDPSVDAASDESSGARPALSAISGTAATSSPAEGGHAPTRPAADLPARPSPLPVPEQRAETRSPTPRASRRTPGTTGSTRQTGTSATGSDGQDGAATGSRPAGTTTGPDGVAYTPAGLPWRVRQASLVPALRGETPDDPPRQPDPSAPATPARAPEEIRRMMSSYQSGTLRGRSESGQPNQGGRHLAAAPDPEKVPPTAEAPGNDAGHSSTGHPGPMDQPTRELPTPPGGPMNQSDLPE